VAKDTYPGGSTLIRLDEDGTRWGSSDAAEGKKRTKQPAREYERSPTKKEIELEEQREDREERKILRGFISQCAAAYAAKKLTASEPRAPRRLRKRAATAGGNIRWLENNRQYQILFHQAYCHLRNEKIRFEQIWEPRPR
jgi:hypothetical protein